MAQAVEMTTGQAVDEEIDALVQRRGAGDTPPPLVPELPFGPDDEGQTDGQTHPIVSNHRLGMLLFLAFEAMFFAGLIGAFLVFRVGSVVWPPPGQPRLPVMVTGVNTVILLISGYTMHRAFQTIRAGDRRRLAGWLVLTAVLGLTFLAVQGYEWARLVEFGLTVASGAYGFTFYTLVGVHGVHVLCAVLWLLCLLVWTTQGRFSATRHVGVDLCRMYWYFVVALWPVLYTLVYLN